MHWDSGLLPCRCHDSIRTSPRTTRQRFENGKDPVRVRLAPPPLSGLLRIVLVIVATPLAAYLAWRLRGVIQLLVISLFFVFALFPVIDTAVLRTGAPRAVVIPGVYVMLALLVGVIGYVVIPSVVQEVHTLSRDAPHYAAELRHNAMFRHYDDRYVPARLNDRDYAELGLSVGRRQQRYPPVHHRHQGCCGPVHVGSSWAPSCWGS